MSNNCPFSDPLLLDRNSKTPLQSVTVKTQTEFLEALQHICNSVAFVVAMVALQSGRVVKAYEYYQTCIATKTFEFFGFLSEARNDTPNLTACCTNVPNLILLKIGHLCLSFVQVFP